MIDELIAFKDGNITQELFNEKLALHQYKFNNELKTKVKGMLPNQNLPKLGND